MAIVKSSLGKACGKQVDSALKITELFAHPACRFDIAVADLKGTHASFVNDTSDKVYLVLEGQGRVSVDGEGVEVGPMDVVFIPPGAVHGVEGDLKFLCIMSPPFDPAHDKQVG